MRYLTLLVALVAAMLAVSACDATQSAPANPVSADQPWARAAIAGGNGASYMVLKNTSGEAVKLLSAASDVAQTVEVHQTTMVNGTMQMSPVKEIPIAAGGQVELKPGGFHIMMIGLKRELKVGEKITVVLTFDKGPALTVSADVKQQ